MAYLGTTPIPGLTARQRASVEGALKGVDAALHDGLLRDISAELVGAAPWSHAAVVAAVYAAMSWNGLPLPRVDLVLIGRDETTNLQGAGRLTTNVATP
jgi:hypothetical protein